MSLKVWLPLNGDLENKGISNIVITANGASINTSGKIGSCYSFDGSDDYISLDSSIFYDIIKGGTQPFSIAMWIYHNDSTRAILFGDYSLSGGIGFNIELTTAHQIRFYWNGSPDKNFNSDSSVGLQTWTHITLTYDGSQILLYKNGSVISDKWSGALASKTKTSGVYYLGRDSRTGATALNGRLNDFRLYDHCLSAAEVKEISQGLILHYKLDDITNGIKDSSGYNHNGTSINSIELSDNSPRYNNCLFLNATNKKIKCGVLNVEGFNKSFTIAWWGKCSSFSGKMMWGFSDGIRLNGIYNGNLWNTGDGTSNPLYIPGTTTQVSAPSTNVWHHFAMTGNGTKHYVYLDGELWAEAKNYKLLSGTQIYINGWDTGTSYSNDNLSISDFRIYATPLLDNDIKSLYNIGMKIDNLSNIHAFEFDEEDQNVLAGIPWTSPYSIHSTTQNLFTNYNSDGEPQFIANSTSAGSQYIEITPGTYYYDMTISVNSGNQFYVGFERYDANKTARENSACAYVYTTKPTSNVVKQRYKGTVNLSTDGVNTLKYITLRVLNGWSGTTSGVTGQATIHHLSLRPVTGAHSPKLKKAGQLDLSELKEYSKSSFYQNRLVEAAEFIER